MMHEKSRPCLMLRVSWNCGKLYDSLCDPVGAEYKLTQNEMDVILFLYNNKELNTAKEISNYRAISKSLVCKSVKSLTERGFITSVQDDIDRRMQHLFLTEQAAPVAEELKKVHSQFTAELSKGVSPEERETLHAILEKVAKNVGIK